MKREEFIERIRLGVLAGIYDRKAVIEYMNSHGWHTTSDVPPHECEPMIKHFEDDGRYDD